MNLAYIDGRQGAGMHPSLLYHSDEARDWNIWWTSSSKMPNNVVVPLGSSGRCRVNYGITVVCVVLASVWCYYILLYCTI